jgi:hypothetical protein
MSRPDDLFSPLGVQDRLHVSTAVVSWLGFLVIGSTIVVVWRWDSLSWHARGTILAAYGVTLLGPC